MDIINALVMVLAASVAIMFACESFDEAGSFLGRNMKPGIRGATINAIGSSLPELMTAMFLLFLYQDRDGFSAGIATTAGSAVFNSVVIPMMCIFAVTRRGVLVDKTKRVFEKVKEIRLDKPGIARDGFFLLLAEGLLIEFLGGSTLMWWMGGLLMLVYAVYFMMLMRGFKYTTPEEKAAAEAADTREDDDDDDDDSVKRSKFMHLIRFEFNDVFFDGKPYTDKSAWVVLTLSVIVVSAACYVLAEAVIQSADALGVPAYFTAVILAAAASSVPDTILSMKDAVKGEYDDAMSNAFGSNIFDITVALGLPLLIYGLVYGNVELSAVAGESNSEVQVLRIVLFAVTAVVMSSFLVQNKIRESTAWFFLAIFSGWIGYIVYSAGLQAGWF